MPGWDVEIKGLGLSNLAELWLLRRAAAFSILPPNSKPGYLGKGNSTQPPSLAQALSAPPAATSPAQLKRMMERYSEQHYVPSIKKRKNYRRWFEQLDLVEGVPAHGRGMELYDL